MSLQPPQSQFPVRAFQWDLARQVERLDFLLKWLPRYAEWGYQELYLHLEDAVEYPSLPGVARRDAYSYAQFGRLVQAATAAGIRVVPIVNLLGHTQYLIKVPGLRDLNELRDRTGNPLVHGQICPLHPRTLEVAGKLLRDVAPFCTAGKVHVGLDESFHLGKCPRCRADIRRAGLAGHFAAHVDRLHALTSALGLRLGLWADMLALLPAAVPRLPRDVIVYDWYYYPFARLPRVELHNFAAIDLASPLQARGIEYWGCPMNGAFRYEPLPLFGERMANIVSWWRRCCRVGAGGFLVTSWEANRLAIELTTAVDAAAACLWLEPGVDDPREMLARGFARVFRPAPIGVCRAGACRRAASPDRGMPASSSPTGWLRSGQESRLWEARQWARAALAADGHAFSGYYRWQINERWDVCAGREPLAVFEREAHTLERLCRSLLAGDGGQGRLQAGSYKISPPALRASLAFRFYLAQRDVFVRRAAQAVFQLRRTVARQRAASDGGIKPARHSLGDGGRSRPTTFDPRIVGRGHPTPPFRSQIGAALALLQAEAAAFARALRAGRAAARAMWNRSRDPRRHGPNERMLDHDAERLRGWRLWLGRARSNPNLIWQATPVCGVWQLEFTVHNFAPALQRVVVEQQQPDGSWVTLHALPLMEFRAFAARPRTKITREISIPVGPALAAVPKHPMGRRSKSAPLPLRLAVRGVGRLAISDIELTDGVSRLRPRAWPPSRRKILGRPAPRREFPAVDWTKNQNSNRLTFRPSRNSSQGKQSTSSRFRRSLPR